MQAKPRAKAIFSINFSFFEILLRIKTIPKLVGSPQKYIKLLADNRYNNFETYTTYLVYEHFNF